MPEPTEDPRVMVIAYAITEARGVKPDAGPNYHAIAKTWAPQAAEALAELDMQSPDATIRRLQREMFERDGNDMAPEDWAVWRAVEVVREIDAIDAVIDSVDVPGLLATRMMARRRSLIDELEGLE